MNLTKLDMARVIITALYNRPTLAEANDPRVLKLARCTVAALTPRHQLAVNILLDREARH